jgi:phospholipid-transporting ATPase
MSADFLRLVSKENPSVKLPTDDHSTHGYPPVVPPYSDSSPVATMDPFFDDDDPDVPDSAFASRPPPMQSQESGLPLSRNAAAPAGHSKVSLPSHGPPPAEWTFDDDTEETFNGSATFPGQKPPVPDSHLQAAGRSRRRRRWRWPWQKEQALLGERVIVLNNEDANADFSNNFVSTSKYNMVIFIPKFLTGKHLPYAMAPDRSHTPLMRRTILQIR